MIEKSELILNNDGSVFHLHLKSENLARNIILVGDQARVDTVASYFDSTEFSTQNREFRSVTGYYRGTRFTVLSTGIGTDNIDIVLNELDALVNIDLDKRELKKEQTSLNIVRIGTSGSLQHDLPVNGFVVAKKAIGFDGVLNFYANREKICDLPMEEALKQFTGWNDLLPSPYIVNGSELLLNKFDAPDFIKGVTISTPGFYGPQGRVLRLPLAMPDINTKLEQFRYGKHVVSNYEMESSAIYGLSRMLGHEALAVCLVIDNRLSGQANENYHPEMYRLIEKVLNCLAN